MENAIGYVKYSMFCLPVQLWLLEIKNLYSVYLLLNERLHSNITTLKLFIFVSPFMTCQCKNNILTNFTTAQKFGVFLFFKVIYNCIQKDALNCSKVTVKTYIT